MEQIYSRLGCLAGEFPGRLSPGALLPSACSPWGSVSLQCCSQGDVRLNQPFSLGNMGAAGWGWQWTMTSYWHRGTLLPRHRCEHPELQTLRAPI